MAWVGALAGGVLSYLGSQDTNDANAANARNAGHVNVTTTRDPMAGTQPYRSDASEAAYEALFGHPSGYPGVDNPYNLGNHQGNVHRVGEGADVVRSISSPDSVGASSSAGAGGRAAPPPGYRYSNGRLVKANGAQQGSGAGAGAGAAPAGPNLNNTSAPGGGKFNGISQYTQDAENALRGLPAQEQGLYDTGQQYVQGTLSGNDQNPLRGQAVDAGNAISDDPQLAAYEAALRGNLGGAAGPGGGPGGGGGTQSAPDGHWSSSGWVASPAGQTAALTSGSTTGADAAIRDMLAGKATAGQMAAEDAIRSQVERGRAANIRDLRARAVGSGFYGGNTYQQLEEGAIAQGDQATAEQIAASRFGAYQSAMGLGTQYDLGMADVAARNNSTSAGAASSAAALAQQDKLAQLGMWGDAIRTGQTGRAGTASALGSLAGQYSNDQQASLAGIGTLAGNRRADLTAAGDLSRDSDQIRTSYGVGMAGANASRAVGMANVGLGEHRLAFDQEQFHDPLNRISAFSNALNGLTGAYGSETTLGQDQRNQSPPAYNSPYGAALTGAGVGGQIGSSYGH